MLLGGIATVAFMFFDWTTFTGTSFIGSTTESISGWDYIRELDFNNIESYKECLPLICLISGILGILLSLISIAKPSNKVIPAINVIFGVAVVVSAILFMNDMPSLNIDIGIASAKITVGWGLYASMVGGVLMAFMSTMAILKKYD